jgi:hypothetical protein
LTSEREKRSRNYHSKWSRVKKKVSYHTRNPKDLTDQKDTMFTFTLPGDVLKSAGIQQGMWEEETLKSGAEQIARCPPALSEP